LDYFQWNWPGRPLAIALVSRMASKALIGETMQSIQFTGVGQWLSDKIGMSPAIVTALALGGFVAWICWRGRSTHVFMTLVWRKLYGRTAIADKTTREFIQKLDALMAIRILLGIPVRTLESGQRLFEWIRTHDEDIATVKACGTLFDVENCQLREDKIPALWLLRTLFLLVFVLILGTSVSVLGTMTDEAIMNFNESGNWFRLSTNSVSPLFGKGTLTASNCGNPLAGPIRPTAFTSQETTAICEALGTQGNSEFVKGLVAKQRVAFAFCDLWLIYALVACWSVLRQGAAARRIRRGLSERAQKLSLASEVETERVSPQ
jgi:hypothetical protein